MLNLNAIIRTYPYIILYNLESLYKIPYFIYLPYLDFKFKLTRQGALYSPFPFIF
jgi:hypothetical protein